ncbi:SMI1/KNR4 family protein [Egbenema bharatensis]|uniref:SMI1/KNR4 family protein n=1 Tax=Egbenema bharatensis TaxID=3463334 RepID=UPI003A89E62F
MSSFDWERFLRRWSQEILETLDYAQEQLPPEVIERGWLGYPGATEAQIAQAEVRLGTTLPPSYRAFLKVTNGWRQTTPFIHHLWSVEEILWFADRHPKWLNTWLEKSEHLESPAQEGLPLSVEDKEYFVYGSEQDCSKIRAEYLQTALEISKRGEAAIYLLNPQVITEEGEWEAWFLGDWLPGADRYRSFQAMMQAEYESFLELREPPQRSVRSSSKQPHGSPTAVPPDDWQTLASFIIKFQTRQIEGQPEQRTMMSRHVETDTVKTIPGNDPQTVQEWMVEQLETVIEPTSPPENSQPPASLKQPPVPPAETVTLEITQLRVISETEPSMMVDLAHPVFPVPIQHGQPFTLEVIMNIKNSTVISLEPTFACRIQGIAHEVTTCSEIDLGEMVIDLSTEPTEPTEPTNPTDRIARFTNLKLQQPGIYRLKVWVTPQNFAASPGYFKVPMLQVL